LAAVADVLLSTSARSPSPALGDPPGRVPAGEVCPGPGTAVAGGGPADAPAPVADPPRGLYVLVPAGVAPAARREAALAAAGRLAARRRPAGVLLFEAGRVDAHVVGETASGRLGPQNYLGGTDLDQAVRRLAGHCDPIALVPLDSPDAILGRPGPAGDGPVFLVEADAEGLVEAYRALKTWRRSGAAGRSAILFAGGRQADAAPLHARLRHAARAFLGCDLARQRVVSGGAAAHGTGAASGVRIFAGAPAEAVWAPLLAVAAGRTAAAAGPSPEPSAPAGPWQAAVADGVQPDAGPPAPGREAGPRPASRPAFALWQPESRDALLDAAEAQLPALLGGRFRQVFRVDVDEPGAPPLVAVRDDGTLVAILFGEPDEFVRTGSALAWLRVHWSLLARMQPDAGLVDGPRVGTIVLAAARPGRAADGVRRFVPVRLGGHKGIVLLP